MNLSKLLSLAFKGLNKEKLLFDENLVAYARLESWAAAHPRCAPNPSTAHRKARLESVAFVHQSSMFFPPGIL